MKKFIWICLLLVAVGVLATASHQVARAVPSDSLEMMVVTTDVATNKDGGLPNGVEFCVECTACPATYLGKPISHCVAIGGNLRCFYQDLGANYYEVYNQGCSQF
jgi:hypothetical protein